MFKFFSDLYILGLGESNTDRSKEMSQLNNAAMLPMLKRSGMTGHVTRTNYGGSGAGGDGDGARAW